MRASFVAKLPSLGYQVYAVSPEANPNKPVVVAHPNNVLENEHLRIQIAPNGTFNMEHKLSGQIYSDLGYIEDGGDCGDGYNYSYPLEDRLENTLGAAPRISRISNGSIVQRYVIEYDYTLPESIEGSRRKRSVGRSLCPLSVTLSLAQGSPRLDLQVSFDNHARDHRLRMVFPSDLNTKVSHSSAPFDVVDHPIMILPVPENSWVEDAPATFPQQGWVDLSAGERGFCVISQGLPEYEVLDTERHEIAITLLRAVGFLGAEYDMQTAVVGAGPTIATPEGQIQRKLTFNLSLLPHSGTWDKAEVWRQAQAFTNQPRAYTTVMEKSRPEIPPGVQPDNRSFLSMTGRNIILSCLKKAETGEALIVRVYNPSRETSEAIIHVPFIPKFVQLCGMDESPKSVEQPENEPTIESDGVVRVNIASGKIVSLRMERK